MKTNGPSRMAMLLALSLLLARVAFATVRYVNVNNASPAPPYTNWVTASVIIQQAVDAATAGDEIVVTNGVYATGGRAVVGKMTNRVAVTKPLTVRSVNGPEFTIIRGYQVPGTTNGDGAIRCVYLTNGASLSGFTLANGATRKYSDNYWQEACGGGLWCESAASVVSNCVITGNTAVGRGGGALAGTLNNCSLTDNWASQGGGGGDVALNNCRLTRNSAYEGGGVYFGTMNNCTLTGNSAYKGGGVYFSTLSNCILYFNAAEVGANYYSGELSYCCTTPATSGFGNIWLDPQLTSASHISAASPCRGAGRASFTRGTDIDGEAWANPPAIGCDEYHAGSVAGILNVGIGASFTNVAPGFPVSLTALIEGRPASSVWNFGDGASITNQPYTTHAWTAPGHHVVVLSAYNDSHPEGVTATFTVHIGPEVNYVAANNPNPLPPYTSWATAATNIQAAVDAAAAGALVLVSNGVYTTGARAAFGSNRVAVSKPLTVRSVNGPEFTAIDGRHLVRCVYLGKDTHLSGFTVTNGVAAEGGGVWCESISAIVSNCVLTGNSAGYGGGVSGGTLNNCMLQGNLADSAGGGAYSGTLNNCTLTENSARFQGGGGADYCTLNNCALTGNSAYYGGGASGSDLNDCTLTGNRATSPYLGEGGGGAYFCQMRNCIVYFNSAQEGANHLDCSLGYCCTTPLPRYGSGNITLDPQLASASHLSAGSPCRGAGSAEYATGTDIDGEAWADPPSIGCDEFQAGPATGPLSVSVAASFTNVAAGFTVNFTGSIFGPADSNSWDFGDGTIVHSEVFQPFAAHSWASPGDYLVVLRAFNQTYPDGISATVTVHVVTLPVHYVSAASTNPVAPYASWATAATTIQAAVAPFGAGTVPGALVLVADGIYATGGSVGGDGEWSRVVVGSPLTLRSVNGPRLTVIDGAGTSRCVYLTSDASLSGFTLTNGAAYNGGGLFCESISATASNCVLESNWAYSEGGGAYGGMLNNCTLSGNTGYDGGGAIVATLNNCALTGNSADRGGGAYLSEMNNCVLSGNLAAGFFGNGGGASHSKLNNSTLTGNSAQGSGGGAYLGGLNNCTIIGNSATEGGGASGYEQCNRLECYGEQITLNHCTLTGNFARANEFRSGGFGGGVSRGTLNDCVITDNSAEYSGGGASWSTLDNCALTGNRADVGGGAAGGTLNNCTLTGNSATNSGGGVLGGRLQNCIVYFNTARNEPNYSGDDDYYASRNYCCTTPLPEFGTGNFTNEPAFVNPAAGDFRLRPDSPCIDAGTNLSAFFTRDLDGSLRPLDGNGDGVAIFDIGAYEFDRRSCMPVLAGQPQSQIVNEGGSVTLTVAADGLTPLLYQWRFNGSDISAATNSWLTLTGVQITQAGFYSVRITNDCGDVVSSDAVLHVNIPPVADASATPTSVISANGIDARVGLDGSRSSDPDGDSLEYLWLSNLNAQPSNLIATGMVAVVVLRVGTHPLALVVRDGLASSTNPITLTVLTTGQGVQRLIGLVNGSDLHHPRPLVATLEAALAASKRGNLVAAAQQLRAFQNQVRAQVASVDPALAETFLAAVQQVLDALGGSGAGRMVGKFHALQPQRGGHVQWKFTGTPGGVHVVQASTNLLDWETVGVAVDRGDGQFEFEDAKARRFPTRFYRIVSP